MRSFNVSRLPALSFGVGKISDLWKLAEVYGNRIGLITGAGTIDRSPELQNVLNNAEKNAVLSCRGKVVGEPTPTSVNSLVEEFRTSNPEVIIAIGGGSVVDGGKAVAAMLCADGDVRHYLEGIGTRHHPGMKIPFIAVPTTAGTGSEATKNAVISEVGDAGYKRSLRHDNFVPDAAVIDPGLMISCPRDVTAWCGMDAFTQLLESYLSTNANPFTDTMALEGLGLIARSLRKVCLDGNDVEARSDMAMAAYLSGVTLANAGLGTVHGIAGPFGGFYQIPHGQICSALMAPINRRTVEKLRSSRIDSGALEKYARVGRLFNPSSISDNAAIDSLLDAIHVWSAEFGLSKITYPGVDVQKIAGASDNKSNPVKLTADEITQALAEICT